MLQWEEKYSVGIQSIDLQHQEIFKLINRLLEALKEGQAMNVINPVILELERYAVLHFQKEEYFFKRFNYAHTEEHIRGHQYFIQQVQGYKSDIKSGNITVSIKLLQFLKEWIQHHILEVDHHYSQFFRENGLK